MAKHFMFDIITIPVHTVVPKHVTDILVQHFINVFLSIVGYYDLSIIDCVDGEYVISGSSYNIDRFANYWADRRLIDD